MIVQRLNKIAKSRTGIVALNKKTMLGKFEFMNCVHNFEDETT